MESQTGGDLPGNETDHTPGHRFLGVIPIARAAATDHLVIVLVALERFDTYSSLAMQVFLAADHPRTNPESGGHTLWPMPMLTATDDLGTTYRAEPGGGVGGNQHYRLDSTLIPAIPRHARTLSIALEGVSWNDLENGHPPDVTAGRRQYNVDLAKQLDATPVPPTA